MFEKMEKAFDVGALGEEFKSQGMEVAEESVKIMVKVVMPWLKRSFELSETKIDDIMVPLMDPAQAWILGMTEDINKADNEVK
jgi:hypothetical protein